MNLKVYKISTIFTNNFANLKKEQTSIDILTNMIYIIFNIIYRL